LEAACAKFQAGNRGGRGASHGLDRVSDRGD